ncbi:GNAT family N-acetyltransferase [Thiospirochaeta perfilievii]|uniref:GNAT family N-acetyltransferase n=1 Tax=Thiospirochaeta perfilievii TaxID=252967 RepID=A0A5C1QEV1_9SPIO|nr:GNAT family N-acetyltransferase [Thiospirochaeta perfilievii]
MTDNICSTSLRSSTNQPLCGSISVFASEKEREVGIKTFQGFQKKGLAYVTACAYIEECLKYNFIPVWSCFSENEVSIRLAEKLGYKIEAHHPIYFAEIGN